MESTDTALQTEWSKWVTSCSHLAQHQTTIKVIMFFSDAIITKFPFFQQIVGSDIAELLMQGSHSDGSWESDAPTLIDFSEGATAEAPPCKGDDLLTGNWSSFSSETSEKALQSYTHLLLAGRKKVFF